MVDVGFATDALLARMGLSTKKISSINLGDLSGFQILL